jgi:N utilization substance protein B
VEKQEIKARRWARKMALQGLYQWLMSGNTLIEIEAQVRALNPENKMDPTYFSQLLYGVETQLSIIEAAFTEFLDRPIQSLNPIEHTILRISSYELLFVPEIPYRVILDESVSLARTFGSQEGHRYVNGVLNNLARKVRSVEIEACS